MPRNKKKPEKQRLPKKPYGKKKSVLTFLSLKLPFHLVIPAMSWTLAFVIIGLLVFPRLWPLPLASLIQLRMYLYPLLLHPENLPPGYSFLVFAV